MTDVRSQKSAVKNQVAINRGDAKCAERILCGCCASALKPISDLRLLVSGLCALLFALCFFGAILLALGFPAQAQQANRVYRIGYLSAPFGIDRREEGFRQGLRELGYIEGQNVAVEWRFAKRKLDRLPELAAELVRLKLDVLVTPGAGPTRAARKQLARSRS